VSLFHAGIIGVLATLASVLIVTFSPVHVGVVPAHTRIPWHCEPTRLWLTSRGTWLEGRPVAPAELPGRLARACAVTIEVDDGAAYGDVIGAIDGVRQAGVTAYGVW